MYQILKICFHDHPNYQQLFELFQNIVMEYSLGKLIDSAKLPAEDYNMDTYVKITVMKTSSYTFYLPIAAAYIYMNKGDEGTLKKIKELSELFGEYYQIQNDYLDCYGSPVKTGKVGTDIENNRCTWLLIKCVELCTDEEKKTLYENVGKPGDKEKEIIKNLYKKYNIQGLYKAVEDEKKKYLFNIIRIIEENIEKSGLNKEFFKDLLEHIYHRDK